MTMKIIKVVTAMESVNRSNGFDIVEISREINKARIEIQETENKYDELNEQIAEAQQVGNVLTEMNGHIVEAGDTLSLAEAESINIAVEHFCKRIGYKSKKKVLSFEGRSYGYSSLNLGLENIISSIWEAIKGAFRRLMAWMKSIWDSLFNRSKNTDKKTAAVEAENNRLLSNNKAKTEKVVNALNLIEDQPRERNDEEKELDRLFELAKSKCKKVEFNKEHIAKNGIVSNKKYLSDKEVTTLRAGEMAYVYCSKGVIGTSSDFNTIFVGTPYGAISVTKDDYGSETEYWYDCDIEVYKELSEPLSIVDSGEPLGKSQLILLLGDGDKIQNIGLEYKKPEGQREVIIEEKIKEKVIKLVSDPTLVNYFRDTNSSGCFSPNMIISRMRTMSHGKDGPYTEINRVINKAIDFLDYEIDNNNSLILGKETLTKRENFSSASMIFFGFSGEEGEIKLPFDEYVVFTKLGTNAELSFEKYPKSAGDTGKLKIPTPEESKELIDYCKELENLKLVKEAQKKAEEVDKKIEEYIKSVDKLIAFKNTLADDDPRSVGDLSKRITDEWIRNNCRDAQAAVNLAVKFHASMVRYLGTMKDHILNYVHQSNQLINEIL